MAAAREELSLKMDLEDLGWAEGAAGQGQLGRWAEQEAPAARDVVCITGDQVCNGVSGGGWRWEYRGEPCRDLKWAGLWVQALYLHI